MIIQHSHSIFELNNYHENYQNIIFDLKDIVILSIKGPLWSSLHLPPYYLLQINGIDYKYSSRDVWQQDFNNLKEKFIKLKEKQ